MASAKPVNNFAWANHFGVRRGIAALVFLFFKADWREPLSLSLLPKKENTKAAIPRRTPKR
jgi:hypothetical protein